jgi:XTP/dITP diphosphohydrolase
LFFESLLLATGNRGKYEEFQKLLPPSVTGELLFAPDALRRKGAQSVQSPEDFKLEETGATYAMNAFLKARAWALASGLPSLGDDSGLEVEGLSWAPGIRSARVVEGSDGDRNRWLLSQMEGREDRRARFVAALALSVPFSPTTGEWTILCEGVCDGRLGKRETGQRGFGYDPLFIPEGYDVSFGELPSDVKNKISHRAKAVEALLEILLSDPVFRHRTTTPPYGHPSKEGNTTTHDLKHFLRK